MERERIALSQRERDRSKVLHEVEQHHLTQVEAGRRLRLTDRRIRRLLVRLRRDGDRALVHGLRGRPSDRRLPTHLAQRVLARVRQHFALTTKLRELPALGWPATPGSLHRSI